MKTNGDLTQLVALGYLKEWPKNPLNNWEPMKVLTGESFSEGDLVFKLPPSSYFTTIEGGPAAVSFMVFVYGPIEAEGRYGKFTITDQNKAWGSPPHGALYGWDYWVESDSQRKERERQIREYLESHPEEAARLEESRR